MCDQLVAETSTSQQTDIYAPGGIRTHNPSKRLAVDPRLRPFVYIYIYINICIQIDTLRYVHADSCKYGDHMSSCIYEVE